MRKIIHIDMDAFYASIEQRDNPEFRGKPLAVGYAGSRGVVATASYEARKFGVHSAMPSRTALKKCPHLLFTLPRFDVYKSVSQQIMSIFLEYTPLVEPLSLDEAYLDVTQNLKNIPSATLIAKELKRRIKAETGLTASAGVSVNKFLAKIASDYRKPDGLFVITPDMVEQFVEELPIEKFFGIGKVTAEKMHSLGIATGADLKKISEEELVRRFGKAGHSYYSYAHGIDERVVNPDRVRKSMGAENTFLTDLDSLDELAKELHGIADEVWQRMSSRNFFGRTVTLKVKYSDFEQITRGKTLLHPIKNYDEFWQVAKELLEQVDLSRKKVRLIGLTQSNIDDATVPEQQAVQLRLNFE